MNESIFETSHFQVPYTKYNEPFYLLPFGDVHYGNPNHHEELFNEWCEWAKEKPRSMFLGMGDYIEWFSDGERNGLRVFALHQSSQQTLEDVVKKLVEDFYEKISFMKGRVIGMLEGNHFYLFQNGMTSTQLLCQKLDCKYFGASALSRISFRSTTGNKSFSIDVFSHHGKGASRLVGGSLNTVQQMAECAEADIYLMGHDHKKSVGMSSRLKLTDGRTGLHLKDRKIIYARTGSFLKGYVEGKESYVTKKLLNPTDLGSVKIELTPRMKSVTKNDKKISEKQWADIHASI
jgi:hypothetical protein